MQAFIIICKTRTSSGLRILFRQWQRQIRHSSKMQTEIPGDFCGESHLWEPNCVEVENGHIVMYMRDRYKPRINMAESFDYSRTWKHNGRINMYNSDAKLTLFKIRDKIFLISNVADSMEFAGRKSLQINRSNDGCKTWEFVDFVDEIFKLREQREKCTVDTAARDAQISRINDLQDFIKEQRTNLAEFNESLVKRWLKQITVRKDHFTVELKSGLKIDIEG